MLGGIVATAELLAARAKPGSSEATDLCAIVDQAGKASHLIRQILAFSRQEMLQPRPVDLAQLFERLAPTLAAVKGPARRLDVVAQPGVIALVDPSALERVLLNLVLNARDATGPRGHIRLASQPILGAERPPAGRAFMRDIAYAMLSVEDDGPGVAPEHEARVFEPYFTTRPQGQGLGLATAYGLVKQSGGYLLLDRSPLGGARFAVYLPRAEARPATAGRRAPGVPDPLLLFAEDDVLLRRSVARGLRRAGFRVREAADGMAALGALEAEPPTLLLSDVRMPGMDGIALTRAVRARFPDLPVLLVSGYADGLARDALPDLDVAWLEKPFALPLLVERLHALL
jgi:two-component system cell cycle sensor histidine kinase/response regulator CckA